MSQAMPEGIDENYLDRRNLCNELTKHEAGIAFMQWLVRLTGFNKPIMSLEDASRRDVWLSIRRYIDVSKLGEIEYKDLRDEQLQERLLMEALKQDEHLDELFPGGNTDE